MNFNVHAGHNPSGKTACGAVGFLNESNQARKVAKEVIRLLKSAGHTVRDCTCDNGKSKEDVLAKIVALCNAKPGVLDISIHFNSGRKDPKGDGKIGGVEVLLTNNVDLKGKAAKLICEEVSKLGYFNRGVKVRTDLAFLNRTKAPAILVECCFVDDMDDYRLYQKGNYQAMAKAIVLGITKAIR